MARKYVTEVLKALNDDVGLFQTEYKVSGDGGLLGKLFRHAYLPEHRFLLPEGAPPYKENNSKMGMTPANFQIEIPKLYIFCRADLKPTKRETMFVELLEALHPEEAVVLLAIKEQNLDTLYPNLTRDALAEAGFFPKATKDELKDEAIQVKK